MTKYEPCKKVISLLALYIDAKLDKNEMRFVKKHLDFCPHCYRRYIVLKELIAQLRSAYEEVRQNTVVQEKNKTFSIREHEHFLENLSAYFDNELSLNECVDMKKYMIKFPNVRKDLESMCNLRKLLSESCLCVQKKFSDDYARNVCIKVLGKSPSLQNEILLKVASFTGVIIMLATLVGANLPISKIVREKGNKLLKKTIYVQYPVNHELASDLMQQH